MTSVRHGVRAILFDGDEIILFRRVRPGVEPYWTTPGGGVEPTDASPELALRRELDEELGAVAGPALRVFSLAEPGRLSTVYACRLVSMDLSRRSGPEFLDPDNGVYEIRRIRPEDAGGLNFVPAELATFLAAEGAGLPALLDVATAPGRYRPVVDVHLLLFDESGRVLLGRRQDTGYADGEWHIMPSGHLEEGESVVAAAAREAREELGIEVGECRVAHVMHHRNPGGTARIGMFLTTTGMSGTPVNAEPHKCAELAWFPPDRLPDRMVPYSRAGVAAVCRADAFSLHGWTTPGAAELAAEAVRAGFAELSACVVAHQHGSVLVISDEETDRLPSTVVKPGEGLDEAVARLAPGDGTRFLGAEDYVSPSGRPGRRFTFATAWAPSPENAPEGLPGGVTGGDSDGVTGGLTGGRVRWLPRAAVSASRLPYADREMIARLS
ncbi:NUDIX domain-containing protein [Microbispora sp. RL4-1S]|uniref:NUDIX domain-containing protein n=1 Tax=Microbispora oryzae TaxID=2806554 RepID=A0A941ARJ7_9ACTN|nr:NUDIX domain-containing protein [Microbispora oryzae]MBP2706199.1 NUDIX domain-containing protein [Microbispora oryzae]